MKTHSSISPLLSKGFKLALINIWRNKFLSLATIFVIGTILFIFNVILAINFIAHNALDDLNKKIDLTIYLKQGTTQEKTQEIIGDIELLPGVEKVKLTSKEDALKQLKTTHPDLTLAFEKYELQNPLPASLNITTTNPSYHEHIAQTLKTQKYTAYLSNVITNNSNNGIITSVSKNLNSLTNFLNQVLFWLIMTFIIGGALIMLNAIQITIFNRKKEISVMKLVGASHWFIRLPFIIESVIYGTFGVILSFIMLSTLSQTINLEQTTLFQYYTTISFYKIFITQLIITILIGIFSSVVAVHDYLNRSLLED